MTFDMEVGVLMVVVMFLLVFLGLVTKIGFLIMGSMMLGIFLDASMVSAGVANLVWGSTALSAVTGTACIVLAAVLVIINAGLLLKLRYG